MDKEEFDKLIKEAIKKYSKVPIWSSSNTHPPSGSFSWRGDWIAEEERYIPLEQDENGVYGYKTLIRVPDSPWLWSPNRFHKAEWVDNRLTAHVSPDRDRHCGIYATKSLDELRGWYDTYESDFQMGFSFMPMPYVLFKVKIRAWGVVVEHSLGFRAEHAEIVEVYDGHR